MRITRLTIYGGKDARRGYYMAHPANQKRRPSVARIVTIALAVALVGWAILRMATR